MLTILFYLYDKCDWITALLRIEYNRAMRDRTKLWYKQFRVARGVRANHTITVWKLLLVMRTIRSSITSLDFQSAPTGCIQKPARILGDFENIAPGQALWRPDLRLKRNAGRTHWFKVAMLIDCCCWSNVLRIIITHFLWSNAISWAYRLNSAMLFCVA